MSHAPGSVAQSMLVRDECYYVGSSLRLIHAGQGLYITHCRPGFNCESLINANCDFSLRAQLLEYNYYYAMTKSVPLTHVLTLLYSCDQR